MKANPEKSYVLESSNMQRVVVFDNVKIKSSLSEKNAWNNF